MVRYEPRYKALAIALAALAGYVDAVGFLKIGGLFVSFMSGNSTRLAIGLAARSDLSLLAGSLIAAFVVGVIIGSVLAAKSGHHRKVSALALATVFLIAAALFDRDRHTDATPVAMALAMGASNAVFQRDGEVSIGVTYMTGTLVKLGQRVSAALLGGARWAWLPYLGLWLGLLSGGYCGAILYPSIGAASLWIAASYAAALTVACALLDDAPPDRKNLQATSRV